VCALCSRSFLDFLWILCFHRYIPGGGSGGGSRVVEVEVVDVVEVIKVKGKHQKMSKDTNTELYY
jgi:hypothetical protein